MVQYPFNEQGKNAIQTWQRSVESFRHSFALIIFQGSKSWERGNEFVCLLAVQGKKELISPNRLKLLLNRYLGRKTFISMLCISQSMRLLKIGTPKAAISISLCNYRPNECDVAHLIYSSTFHAIVSVFTEKFGSLSLQEISGQLILEMLRHPLRTDDFNDMDTWKRPMVLDYLSAVLTTTERGKINRQAVSKSRPRRPLGPIPIRCFNCQGYFSIRGLISIKLSCIACKWEIDLKVQAAR